jgi:hypothetical protein
MIASGEAILLLSGEYISSSTALFINYGIFTVMTAIALHCTAFGWPLWFETQMSKRLPKYLDYANIVVLMFGLLQIANAAPVYHLYLTSLWGTEGQVAQKISIVAKRQVTDNCGKGSQTTTSGSITVITEYPEAYCKKLESLAAPNNLDNILALVDDSDFLHQIVAREVTSHNGELDENTFQNPIAGDVAHLSQLRTLSKYSADPLSEATAKVVALVLLPIGIGLGALKTSIELFGNLA